MDTCDFNKGKTSIGGYAYVGADCVRICDNISISSVGILGAPKRNTIPEVKQLIFREDSKTTIVLWKDGTKTVVKSSENEEFIPEVGFAEALAKKIYGSRSAFLRVVENAYYQPAKKDKTVENLLYKWQQTDAIDGQNDYE